MALTYSAPHSFGPIDPAVIAPDFKLIGVDSKIYSLSNFEQRQILVVIFMCNHCPYVLAVQDRINNLAKQYALTPDSKVAVIGINSNDPIAYTEDSFEAMQQHSKKHGFVFPYLFDETQAVAKAYGALCTPDPFVFEKQDKDFILKYHGRIDNSWKDASKATQHDLANAIDHLLSKKPVDPDQYPAMGCSIKWA